MKTELFSNLGIVLDTVPAELFKLIKDDCARIQQGWRAEKANHTLAGAIEKEYFLSKDVETALEPYLIWLVEEYDKEYRYTQTLDTVKMRPWHWRVDSIWANFQQRYEYNPIHNHYGAMSFVIWVNIPYDLEEEQAESHELNDYAKTVSCFQFVVCNSLGEVMPITIPVDKSFEGKLMMFPAKMMHTVYPFYTSDGYRISVAGNLKKELE